MFQILTLLFPRLFCEQIIPASLSEQCLTTLWVHNLLGYMQGTPSPSVGIPATLSSFSANRRSRDLRFCALIVL